MFAHSTNPIDELLLCISNMTFADEAECIEHLLMRTEIYSEHKKNIQKRAKEYVKHVRAAPPDFSIENFLQEYKLGTTEGIMIMCLAEALLRVPDSKTADALIQDKLKAADWDQHIGESKSVFINASTWGLMLTGKFTKLHDVPAGGIGSVLSKLVTSMGEPVVREALKQAMRIIGAQFVMNTSIEGALKDAKEYENQGYAFSYDMLGEGARSGGQAQLYYQSYLNAIEKIGMAADSTKSLFQRPGISVKLSALHPRYELTQHARVLEELLPRVKTIVKKAVEHNISVSIDAEEANRLDIELVLFKEIISDPAFEEFNGIGFVLQAYQKRAYHVIDFLIELAKQYNKRIPVRLVKGAYWDSEIKHAQELGLPNYPVFTRKSHTDVSYLACAAKILEKHEYFYPQFATHNALTVASIMEIASDTEFEFQRLFGMGEHFYDQIVGEIPCRIYAPVGNYKELLPYLIRRLLENGANTSFINILLDENQPVSKILADPVNKAIRNEGQGHPEIPSPMSLYSNRKNSRGFDLGIRDHMVKLTERIGKFENKSWEAAPLVSGSKCSGKAHTITAPYDSKRKVGVVQHASREQVEHALDAAYKAFHKWNRTPVAQRAEMLEQVAESIEENRNELLALCIHEAGKTLEEAIAEVREAADFCRYYAAQARKQFGIPKRMDGPTGESNLLQLEGRGVFACISPWNFPLAIFTGQVAAALVAGNSVIAKPAAQTPLIAYRVIELMHAAGIPADVLHFLPGEGSKIGTRLVEARRLSGVAFTGSTETAQAINIALAKRDAPIAALIAETGGQNAMLVDSTALPEQAVDDIIRSAFGSAGQRCSALRVLYVQEDIADKLLTLLSGAMAELKVGDPSDFTTDIGPVIDKQARKTLEDHIDKMKRRAELLYATPLEDNIKAQGHFVAPHVFGIKSISELKREVFGPILHVIRYNSDQLDSVIKEINTTGYGLTFGIHSRIDDRIRTVQERVRAGNIYVNRSMTGAVVGVQPFGGMGLSGTGPKAGGPHYLHRFATEKTVTVNTAAIGGNLALLS